MKKPLIALALLTLALGACGSSSKSSSTGTNAPAGNSSATTMPPGGATTAAGGKSGGGGGSSGSFCGLARDTTKDLSTPDITNTSSLKDVFAKADADLKRAEDEAPDAIKGDIKTIADAYKSMEKAFSDANYDVTKLGPSAYSAFTSSKIKDATTAIIQYEAHACGITVPTS